MIRIENSLTCFELPVYSILKTYNLYIINDLNLKVEVNCRNFKLG